MCWMLSFSISYLDLINFHYFADTTERRVLGWKKAQRQGEDRVTLRIRASPAVLSMQWPTLQKMFFTASKFSYVLFCNPTHRTETGTAHRWGTTNSKPPGAIIMMGQSETLSTNDIIFKCQNLLSPNFPPQFFCERNWRIFWNTGVACDLGHLAPSWLELSHAPLYLGMIVLHTQFLKLDFYAHVFEKDCWDKSFGLFVSNCRELDG
jgi:hypothetical protein